ncbi:MAG: ABC transporter substrate-binding protein, partial [Proteobacteria bacterium]|nr:ABC transporter substrate-binding protein [Pseudomonadota bacterium]
APVPAPAPAHAPAWTLRDDEGRLLTLAAPPRRIVSLSPGATAMLFAAGGGARVVGTADFSDEPDAARSITRIGDSHGFDLERILALHPDVVVAWTGAFSAAQLLQFERAGLPVYRHRVARLDDLPVALRRLGALLDTRSTADAAADALHQRIGALRAHYSRALKPRLLLQVWDRPVYTLGGEQLVSDAIEACGYRNVYAELSAAAPAVSLESVAARDPEVIVAVAGDERSAQDWLAHWRAMPQLSAVRHERMLAFVDARLSRLGPGAVGATEALCAQLAANEQAARAAP